MNILIVTGKLQPYRISILNLIAQDENINLTVAHSSKRLDDGQFLFKEVILDEKSVGPFTYHSKGFIAFCNNFDVVVATFYIQKLSFVKLAFLKEKKFKLIYWGIGVKASQQSRYDSKGISNLARYILAKKADAMLFYSEYPIQKYLKFGINKEKLFVMHNTVTISNTLSDDIEKNSVLFVGTLKKAKRIFLLLENYQKAYFTNKDILNLHIVGGGEDYENVIKWVKVNNLEHKIKIFGPVFREEKLEKIFKQAIACISPGQAGLSVLKSFGYGVPFITISNAIHGGEKFNIIHEETGLLYENHNELKSLILDISENIQKYLKMGTNAKIHYDSKRSPKVMVQGLMDSIEYVSK